ncbi:MAG: right-handed parallel beta-helix repeat-containing protein [Planctomycetia bacterium]|nr:right-handed parallel beta-helix repeat-containing protein [Planctomycetia bacterium]
MPISRNSGAIYAGTKPASFALRNGLATALLLLLPAVLPTRCAAVEADVVVAPSGNDSALGTAAAPFATLRRAQQAVREINRREPGRTRPIVVSLRGGTYRLVEPITFAPEDSGTPQVPVVYQAAAGERPLISGGVPITGWQVDAQGRWHVELSEVKAGRWSFTQLFVGDQRRFRPRLPRNGYYQIAGKLPPSERAEGKGFDRFVFKGDDKGDDVSPHWADLNDVEVLAMHKWKMSRLRIASVDAKEHIVNLLGHTGQAEAWTEFTPGNRYLVENVKEALGEPGQWYLDRPTGVLTYIPLPGEKPETTTVIAPRAAELVRFAGRADDGQWVQFIELSGLDFAHANWETPRTGQSFDQAEANLGGAISAAGARRLRVADCVVRQVGAYAIDLGAACQDNVIENCELVDLGAGGVKIGTTLMPAQQNAEALATLRNVVRNCTIAYGGRMHPAAVGVWIGHASQNTIEHNEIFDFYYTGVSVGWSWGYGPSPAHHNRISYNLIHTLGQRVLSDMAGVYTLGISPGTEVDHNRVYDVDAYDYGGWGLYCDEGSSGIRVYDNIVYRTKDGGFHQHYGKSNTIENNIFAFARLQQLSRGKPEDHLAFNFRKNIVLWNCQHEPMHGAWSRGLTTANNLYWNMAGPVRLAGKSLEDRQKLDGQDQGSIVADPLFVAPEKDDFTLRQDSPASKIGFQPISSDPPAGRQTTTRRTTGLPPVPRAFP